ncbi:hypothetical protein BG015_001727 [Linnemannia schmuckeri]|uniref:RING-type domain-containing protein n=1 Tax=Linnemannia schmuckeri TaxID=64567 RepID=A0A9P5VDR3_9FUNG|nr:hypothetical protein BG015_001727 [Linnemannia schmuckeri]
MDTLAMLFPYHSRTQLQEHLEKAGGAVEQAVEALFDVPAPTAHVPTAPSRQSSVQDLTRINSHIHTNTAKRQKQALTPVSKGVVDLTWSDEDDMDFNKDCNGGSLQQTSKATIEIEDDAFDFDDFPRPQSSTLSAGGSNMPSFEDFHKQEQKRIEDKRLKELQVEEQRKALVVNFVSHAQVMFDNISTPYLERLIAENRSKIASDEELIDTCIETIFKTNGKYPKAKRKRDDEEDDEEGDSGLEEDFGLGENGSHQGSSTSQLNPRAKRDFNEYSAKMSSQYMLDSAGQLFQDFPTLSAVSIRAVLNKFSYHYAPAFEYITSLMTDIQNPGKGKKKSTEAGDVRLTEVKKPRKVRPPVPLNTLDPDFRRELLWIRAKIERERAEINDALAEEENLRVYTENNNLKECGCCFDDVPANRIAMCEEGHIFCLSCSRRGAEVELGYRRTVLKCMTAGCTAVFPDSEAVLFLSKPVFEGLMRARQQSELKMAGLDSLVECPFCSYAAIVENDEDKEFRCQGPKCRRVSCRLCKALTHIPLSCEEYRKELEKDNVLSVQHKVEEEMSQALIRECPKCKSRFFKTEGCNKMTCPQCHTHMCYVCKIQIKDYSHFDQSPAGQPAKKKNLCRLWEDTIQRNNDEVKAAAQKTLQELQTQDPNLAAQVRLDIPK